MSWVELGSKGSRQVPCEKGFSRVVSVLSLSFRAEFRNGTVSDQDVVIFGLRFQIRNKNPETLGTPLYQRECNSSHVIPEETSWQPPQMSEQLHSAASKPSTQDTVTSCAGLFRSSPNEFTIDPG